MPGQARSPTRYRSLALALWLAHWLACSLTLAIAITVPCGMAGVVTNHRGPSYTRLDPQTRLGTVLVTRLGTVLVDDSEGERGVRQGWARLGS